MDHKATDRQAGKIADFLAGEGVSVQAITNVINSIHEDVSYVCVRMQTEIHRIADNDSAPSIFIWKK